ncbi:MAG: hypothetical protein QGG84_12880, partial [Rhodospirillales bacterium]|nr:hypothetical protein [Rhodospirillales bacterium]
SINTSTVPLFAVSLELPSNAALAMAFETISMTSAATVSKTLASYAREFDRVWSFIVTIFLFQSGNAAQLPKVRRS